MNKVYQTQEHNPPHSYGNCFRACVASALSFNLDDLPKFEVMGDEWWDEIKKWAKSQKFKVEAMTFIDDKTDKPTRVPMKYLPELQDKLPKGYSILTGKSPRGDFDHCVVAFDGMPYFDPKPGSKEWPTDVVDFIYFTAIIEDEAC